PLGLLPVTSLEHWKPTPNDPNEVPEAVELLKAKESSLRAFWRRSFANVPRVGGGDDRWVASAFAMEPVTRTVRARNVLGGDYSGALYRFLRSRLDQTWQTAQDQLAGPALVTLGDPDRKWHPRV